jgi:hypothetical protein
MKRNFDLWCYQKQATHELQLMLVPAIILVLDILTAVRNRSYANISFKQSRPRNSVGSGNVPMVKIASTDMHYHLDLS